MPEETCPACGGPCEQHSADEGTQSATARDRAPYGTPGRCGVCGGATWPATMGEAWEVLERHGVPRPEKPLDPCLWPMAARLLILERRLDAERTARQEVNHLRETARENGGALVRIGEALAFYGRHLPDCQPERYSHACSCGFYRWEMVPPESAPEPLARAAWTPTRTALPAAWQPVLVWFAFGLGVGIATLRPDGMWLTGEMVGCPLDRVTHWRPLPDGPEEEA